MAKTTSVRAEDLPLREMLATILGPEIARRLSLRQMNNEELFKRYDAELVLTLRNAKDISDRRHMLARFKDYLGASPPSADTAKGFLAQYADRKPRTLARYVKMIAGFMKFCGDPLDLKVRIPKSLPEYNEDSDFEKLAHAAETKKTHKASATRDRLLIDLALGSGMRRAELASLEPADIHADFLVVRSGKGEKDRTIPLLPDLAERLHAFTSSMTPHEKVFKLTRESISNKIGQFAKKAGVKLHTHSYRHKFATDVLESGGNLRQLQVLLGHTSLAVTEVYLSLNDASLREAIDLLAKKRKAAKPNDTDKDSGEESLAQNDISAIQERSGPPVDTRHTDQVRLMAGRLAQKIAVPSLTDRNLWRQLPLAAPGTYYLSLGTVTVSPEGQLAVGYPLPSPVAPDHLERSLYDHLNSSGVDRFAHLTGDRGLIAIWAAQAGQHSLAVLSLLDHIIAKIRSQGFSLLAGDGERSELTKWFAVMAWHDLLMTGLGQRWLEDSWYRHPEQDGDGWLLKCGAFEIARAPVPESLAEDLALHKALRGDRQLLGAAAEIGRQRAELEATAARLRGLLEEFSDFAIVPGHCELCSPLSLM